MSKQLTKEQLASLQKTLIKEEKHLRRQIDQLQEEDPFSNPDHVSDNAAVDTDVREKVGHETIEAQVNSLTRKLSRVTEALQRLKHGNYGVCQNCRVPIKLERLEFLPESRYCVDCERKLVR